MLLFIAIHINSPSGTVHSVTLPLIGVFDYFKYANEVSSGDRKLLTAVFRNSFDGWTSDCALKIATASILKTSPKITQITITFDWLIGFWISKLLQEVHFKIFDFALLSFVIRLSVPKLLDIKQLLLLHLVICPFDSLSTYLEHCPLPQSLASTWKQDLKPNLSVFWNTSTSLCDHSIYRLLSNLWH